MRHMRGGFLRFSASLSFLGLFLFSAFSAYGQDAPSLGDVARQARQQKEQKKDAQSKTRPQNQRR